MNLRQWEIVRAVVTTGSVTRASELLNISQPSVSQAVQRAEDQLGFKLFTRANGRMTPTFEATLLQPEIERVFQHVSGLNDMAHELRRQSFGQINMATIPTLSASILPAVFKEWRSKHPAARARVQVLSTTEVIGLVANHLVDFGLIHTPASDSELQVEEILRTEVFCVMPRGHSLLTHQVIRPEFLRDGSLIAARDSLDAVTESAFRGVGEPLDIGIEVNNALTACLLAANGVGIALVDPFALALLGGVVGDEVEVRPFRPAISLSTRILFSNKRPLSRPTLEFVRLLRGAVTNIAGRIRIPPARLPVFGDVEPNAEPLKAPTL